MNEAKFDALEEYRTSSLFTDAERVALDYVTELTKEKKVDPNTFARLISPLFRARDLRDRLACCQRASLQHDQYRSEHPFGHACDVSRKRSSSGATVLRKEDRERQQPTAGK